jgi:hypothetical protein
MNFENSTDSPMDNPQNREDVPSGETSYPYVSGAISGYIPEKPEPDPEIEKPDISHTAENETQTFQPSEPAMTPQSQHVPFPSPPGQFPVKPESQGQAFPFPAVAYQTFPLESLNAGEIIDRSLLVLKGNFKSYLNPSLLFYSPLIIFLIIWTSIAPLFVGASRSGPPDILKNPASACFIVLLLLGLCMICVFFWMLLEATITKITSDISLGLAPDSGKSMKESTRYFLKLFGTSILVTLVLFGLMSICSVAIVILFATKNIAGIILGIALSIFALLAALYFIFSFILVPQVVVLEDISGTAALARSRELFHSSWDSVAKITTIPFLLNILIQLFTSLPYIGIVLMIFLAPVPVIGKTLLYYDTRINSESFDLEWKIDQLIKESN